MEDKGLGADELLKAKKVLSLVKNLFFEYDTDTEIFQTYIFEDAKKVVLEESSLEKWKKSNIKHKKIFEEDIPFFEKLCLDIEQGCSDFLYKIRMNVFSENKMMEYVVINGDYVSLENGRKVVVGTFSNAPMFYNVSVGNKQETEYNESLDFLTQVYCRQSILNYAKKKIKDNETMSLIVIDIDYFKQVNDTYGHMFGDVVLTMVASVIKTVVGEKGRVGRIGGDEFIIILDNVAGETAIKPILKKVRECIEAIYFDKPDFKVSVSMGAAAFPDDVSNYDELFQVADKALYMAKEKGRNCYVIYLPKRHGTLEEFLSDESNAITNIKKTDEVKCENIKFIIKKVFNEGSNALNEILESLKDSYGLEVLGIFIDEFEKPRYVIGQEEILTQYIKHNETNKRPEYQIIRDLVLRKRKYEARFFEAVNGTYSVLYEYLELKDGRGGAIIAISKDKIKISRNDERNFSIISTILTQII